MRILQITRAANGGGGKSRLVAIFSAEISPDVRVHNLRLLETPSGRRLTYSSATGGQRNATFSPALAEKLTAAATAAMEGHESHDRSAA